MFSTRIPTILGLLLVVAVVGAVIVSFETFSRLPINATGSIQPANVQVTNLSDTAFTFTWTTPSPATGALVVSLPQNTQTVFDDRDSEGKLHLYSTHSITVRNLKGSTDYSVKILSNGKTYGDTGNNPYTVHTSPTLTISPSDLTPAYGSVVSPENQPAEGTLVFLTLEGSQMLSTIVKPSGAWIIPLHLIRTQDGMAYTPTSDRIIETLLVKNDGLSTSAITDTLNDSPVPVMVLGKNYDFRKQQGKAESLPIAQTMQPSSNTLGAQEGPQSISAEQHTVSLATPAEGTALTSQFPLVQGTGIPTKSVTITLGITSPTSDTTTVASDGIFRYTPKSPVPPGKQSVTIMTMDATNKPIAITHAFEILKSGSQVLAAATPSSTLIPSPTQTATLAGQPLPTSATTFPTLALIAFGLLLLLGGTVALTIL